MSSAGTGDVWGGCFRVFKKANSASKAHGSSSSLYKPSLTTVDILEVRRLNSVRMAANVEATNRDVQTGMDTGQSDEEEEEYSPVQLRRKLPTDEEEQHLMFSTDDEELEGRGDGGRPQPDVLELVKSLDQRALQLNEIMLRNGKVEYDWGSLVRLGNNGTCIDF